MAKKNRNRNIIIIVAVVAIIGVLAFLASKKGQSKGEKVTTEKVEKRTIVETVSASGRVYPEVEINVSSDVSGEIIQLLVEEGDSVTKGQLLCRIQPDIYVSAVERAKAAVNSSKANLANSEAQIGQVQASIVQMQAQYDNAMIVFNRQKKLFSDGVIAEADFQQAETQLKTSKANLESAKANLQSAKEAAKGSGFSIKSAEASLKEANDNLARTNIYAPESGIISKLNVEQGERIVGNQMMSGTEIMRIANLNFLEVQVDVSENDVLRVNIGDETDIEVDAYIDRTFTGKVTEIANSATENAAGGLTTDQVTNFIVKIRINPTSYSDLVSGRRRSPFRPGMSASVEIKTKAAEGILTLPIQAVTTREEETKERKTLKEAVINEVVFVYAADTAKMVKVKTGIQDDEYIEILEGLKEGDEVVTGPYSAISRKLEEGKLLTRTDEDKLYGKKDKEED